MQPRSSRDGTHFFVVIIVTMPYGVAFPNSRKGTPSPFDRSPSHTGIMRLNLCGERQILQEKNAASNMYVDLTTGPGDKNGML